MNVSSAGCQAVAAEPAAEPEPESEAEAEAEPEPEPEAEPEPEPEAVPACCPHAVHSTRATTPRIRAVCASPRGS
jgi:hypothetical protein